MSLRTLIVDDEALARSRLRTLLRDCSAPAAEVVAEAAQGAEIAMAATHEDGELRAQPVFCLLRASLAPSLLAFLQAGERKFGKWTAQHRMVQVAFDDAAAFFNANTSDELRQLQR